MSKLCGTLLHLHFFMVSLQNFGNLTKINQKLHLLMHILALDGFEIIAIAMAVYPLAQLVEHGTGIAELTGSNPIEALIFSGFFFPVAYIGKFTAMIILHFDLPPQFTYELFHIQLFRDGGKAYAKIPKVIMGKGGF